MRAVGAEVAIYHVYQRNLTNANQRPLRKLERDTGIKLKKHGHRAKSVFRQGFESLHQMLRMPSLFASQLADFFLHVIRLPLSENFVV